MTSEANWSELDIAEVKELRQAYMGSCRAFEAADQVYKDAQPPRQEAYQTMCNAREALEFSMFASDEDKAAKKLKAEHLAEQAAAEQVAADLEVSNEN